MKFFDGVFISIRKYLDDHDSEGWAAFGVFLAVISLGMYMNYIAFRPVIGDVPAVMTSLLFETAILAWKITANRRRNDRKQNNLANWATWLSVLLAVGMLVVNMFRVGGDKNFEYTAYMIVGAAALVQVVFYLAFTQVDQDKNIIREQNQGARETTRKQIKAKNTIGDLETDVQIIRYIVRELSRIKSESADLPIAQREYLLEAARVKLLSQYAHGKADVEKATAGLSDIDGNGVIGNNEPRQDIPFLPLEEGTSPEPPDF